jgi:hypothetical protein
MLRDVRRSALIGHCIHVERDGLHEGNRRVGIVLEAGTMETGDPRRLHILSFGASSSRNLDFAEPDSFGAVAPVAPLVLPQGA